MSPNSNERFADLVVALLVLALVAAFGATIADLEDGPRRAVVALLGWRVALLPIHEAGHALAGRLFDLPIERVVLGYGRSIARFAVAGVDVVVRAFPVLGFVSFEGFGRLGRPARVFVYAAGVGAEALVVALAVFALGLESIDAPDISWARAIVVAGLAALGLSVFANLVPWSPAHEPNGEGGEVNDGRRILEAMFASSPRRR